MSLDLSDAIALAKDLLKTSGDFVAHDPVLAAQFSERAYEICDDLGIDREMLGQAVQPVEAVQPVQPMQDLIDEIAHEEDVFASEDLSPSPVDLADDIEEETKQASDQLRDLLRQQARVLQSVRDDDDRTETKTKKRGFKLFGRTTDDEDLGALQSA